MKFIILKKQYREFYKASKKGYIALLSVIGLGAVGLAITVTLLLTGVLSSRTGFSVQQMSQARSVATSCVEEALQQILDSGIDNGTGTLTINADVCTYTILSTSSLDIIVQASGISGLTTSKINVVVASSTPRIKLSSWQEVGDF